MGGDKKPSHEYFQSGHGKTVLAEAFLSDEQIRRVLRTTAEDLEALSWAGTHGAVASGMQSVAFTPASAIAAVFAATGQDLGMVGTSSMAHGTGAPRRGRPAGVDPLRRARGRNGRRRHDAPVGPRLARVDRLRRPAARSIASRRSSRQPRSASRSAPRPRWRPRAARTSSRPTTSAAAFGDRARLPLRGPGSGGVRPRLRPRRRVGALLPQRHAATSAPSCCTTSRSPSGYLVIDRWESADAYNAFLADSGTSTCGAATRRASTTSRSCGSGRSRTSGWRPRMKIPPHHDPACWGCGDNPIGLHLPLPVAEHLTEYEAYFHFDERHQGGPGSPTAGSSRGRSTKRSACLRRGTRSRR